MLIDTHSHFTGGVDVNDSVIKRAQTAGVVKIMAVGGDEAMNSSAVQLAETYKKTVYAAVGLARDCAESVDQAAINRIQAALDSNPLEIKAIGETGLDFYYSADSAVEQEALFEQMLGFALKYNLPVIVHSRNAEEATLRMLKIYADAAGSQEKGVLHCFTGDYSFGKSLVDIGFYISFSGIITFKNAGRILDAAARLPEDRILIETDSPFLAPVPHRGSPNESAFLPFIGKKLAEVRRCSYERVAEFTTLNAGKLFNIRGDGVSDGI